MLNIYTYDKKDPNKFTDYRYQMKKLEINHSGKGKNKITTIINLNEVSKDIGHPPDILIKALAGKGSRYDSEKKFIKGTISYDEIEKRLYDYILNFVLCHNKPQILLKSEDKKNNKEKCLKPETELYLDKNNLISKCNVCSGHTPITSNDKLKKSIINDMIKFISNNANIKKKININIKETDFTKLF